MCIWGTKDETKKILRGIRIDRSYLFWSRSRRQRLGRYRIHLHIERRYTRRRSCTDGPGEVFGDSRVY